MLQKPLTCSGCSLADRGRGYVLPSGPSSSPILFVGEAAGPEEAATGQPFIGAAGGLLNRLLARNHQSRDAFRVDNVCRCQPPGMWFDERAPWYFSAREHCTTRHLSETLAEGHRVVVPLGGTALKHLLRMDKDVRVEDWHGTVTRDPSNRFWLVPTFHPSHLQRGAMNLFGGCSFDLQQALRVAQEGFTPEQPDIIVDPDLAWFTFWVEQVEAVVAHDPLALWLAVDIETPDKATGKDEGELTAEDRSYTIVRINFSVHPDEGVTVPYQGPFISLCERLLALACPKLLWAKEYDEPRLAAAGHSRAGDWYDFMWAWHHLQSDVPRGLGFVAPFYSRFGAWKHTARTQPGYYAACDGFQTYRVATGIAQDLQDQGMWETFARHTHALHKLALKPAQEIGVRIDRERLTVFIHDLEVKQRRLLHEMQGMVPEELRPLTPKGGLKRQPEAGAVHTKGRAEKKDGTKKKEAPDPIKQDLYAQVAQVVTRRVRVLGYTCGACGAQDVQKRHRCVGKGRDDAAEPILRLVEVEADRWFWQEPFNPDSPDQILTYLKARGHRPGRAKKTGNDSTDRETLQRLLKETRDPLYKAILDSRAVGKVKGTYGVGTLKRLDTEDRVHPTPTFKPSTHRLSYVNPNITNVITDRGGPENLAAGFRRCVVAAPGTRLAEFDFSGIEAVLSGWFMRDAHYIWLAKLGVHAGLASYVLGRPYEVAWGDARIAEYFKAIKAEEEVLYDRCKRTVHGTNYGLTEFGMVRNFPETFPTLTVARKFKATYAEMAPALPKWHAQVRERAYKQNYLGGPGDHPFGYKHWFWAVLGFRKISYALYQKRVRKHEPCITLDGGYFAVILGDDAKRAVAFYPQSTAAGILKEVMLRLFDPEHESYIGDAYYGKTPFRAPIHDSLLLEIPTRQWDTVVEKVYREMLRPVPELPLDWVSEAEHAQLGLGHYLSVGVAAKAGQDWLEMEKLPSPTLQELGLSTDVTYFPPEDEDEEDEQSLGTVA